MYVSFHSLNINSMILKTTTLSTHTYRLAQQQRSYISINNWTDQILVIIVSDNRNYLGLMFLTVQKRKEVRFLSHRCSLFNKRSKLQTSLLFAIYIYIDWQSLFDWSLVDCRKIIATYLLNITSIWVIVVDFCVLNTSLSVQQ